MREVVFSPLARTLVRLFGASRATHAIAVTIMAVLLLVGIWHGVDWYYAAFALVAGPRGEPPTTYYTLMSKQRLGKERLAAYNRNAIIHAAAVGLTVV